MVVKSFEIVAVVTVDQRDFILRWDDGAYRLSFKDKPFVRHVVWRDSLRQ
jgi:hypothetical protein